MDKDRWIGQKLYATAIGYGADSVQFDYSFETALHECKQNWYGQKKEVARDC